MTHPAGAMLLRAVRDLTDATGDGAVSATTMIAAGLRRAADVCGASPARRVALARGLESPELSALVFDAMKRLEITVPVPVPGAAVETRGDGEDGWSAEDRFRAAIRAATATAFAGAAAPSAARKLTAIVTTLVANATRASGARRRGEECSVHEIVSRLARDPPVIAVRGASVEHSVLVEGVVFSVGLRKLPGDRRRGLDGATLVAALVGEAFDEIAPGTFEPGSIAFDPTAAARDDRDLARDDGRVRRALGSFADLPRVAAESRAAVLARRGVGLLLCSEALSPVAAKALADAGVLAAHLVPDHEIRAACAAMGGALPAASASSSALETCDVRPADGVAERALPGGRLVTHVRVPGAFHAIARGPGPESSANHAELIRRGVRVAAAALDPFASESSEARGARRRVADAGRRRTRKGGEGGEGEGEGGEGGGGGAASLVPGCGACEAVIHAAATRALRGGRGGEGDLALALDVLSAMAKAAAVAVARATASPAAYSGKQRFSDADDSGGGFADPARAANRAALALLARNAALLDAAETSSDDASGATRAGGDGDRLRAVGRVCLARAPETLHPGTAAAIFDAPPPPEAFAGDPGDGSRRVPHGGVDADPAEAAALEPFAGKFACVAAAVAATAAATRAAATARARRLEARDRRRLGGVRRRGGGDASDDDDDDDDGDGESADDSADDS